MAAVNWFTACVLHHFWINSFNLELEFEPKPPILSDQALNFAFKKINKMPIHANNYMIFLKFWRLSNTNRRLEVKKRVDLLTKYDYGEFHARFRLSKHLLSDVCQTHHLNFDGAIGPGSGNTGWYWGRIRGNPIEAYKITTGKEKVQKEDFFEFSATGYVNI